MLELLRLEELAYATQEHRLEAGLLAQPCCVSLGLFPSLSGLRVFFAIRTAWSLGSHRPGFLSICPCSPIWVTSPSLFTSQQDSPPPSSPTFSELEPGTEQGLMSNGQGQPHVSVAGMRPSLDPAITPRLQLLGGPK